MALPAGASKAATSSAGNNPAALHKLGRLQKRARPVCFAFGREVNTLNNISYLHAPA
jgi:hypothetical protein